MRLNGSSKKFFELAGFSRVMSDLKSLDYPNMDPELLGGTVGGDITDPGGSDASDGNDTVSEITACYKNAGVLGWILCPVLEAMSNVVDGLYEYLESNFLQVNSSIVQSSGVSEGWKQFRNAANILFAIFFAVLIFARVTGIGISNYNIKKILPRLIMVVVLVNVSFILCELAVDISNILGAGLRNMFEGFASTAAKASGGVPFNLGTVVGGAIGSLFTVGGAAAVTAVFAITIPWELWLFPFFLAIIGCIVSIGNTAQKEYIDPRDMVKWNYGKTNESVWPDG